MKKIILTALLVPMAALAQTFPSPTFNSLTLQNPLTAANGGTGATSSTGSGSVVLSTSPTISSPTITGNLSATTLSSSGEATLYGLTTPSTGQFYASSGASVSRIQDRLLVGPAALNNATQAASQPDWLTQYQLAKGRTYGFIQTSQFSVLNGQANQDSLTTLVSGAQTAGRTGSASQVIALTGMGVNNNSGNVDSGNNQAWAGYFEAFRDTGTAGNGGAYGIEIDTMNFVGSAAVTDPYSQSGDQTVGAQMASGGGFPGTLYPTTVGINFQNNNATFDKGIVFGSNSLTGDNGTTGTGVAIALGHGHQFQWYGAAGTPTSSITGNGTTAAGGIGQVFNDNQIQFVNSSGQPLITANNVSGAVNYALVTNASTGGAPSISSAGADANSYLTLTGKGSGGVNIAGATDGSSSGSGYVGQVVSQTFSSVSVAASNTPQNLTSIPLPAGDWYVEGYVTYSIASGATITVWQTGISTVSTTFPALGNYWQSQGSVAGGTNVAVSAIAPVSRQNSTTSTTVYLVGQATFSGGTVTASGYLRATRRR